MYVKSYETGNNKTTDMPLFRYHILQFIPLQWCHTQ